MQRREPSMLTTQLPSVVAGVLYLCASASLTTLSFCILFELKFLAKLKIYLESWWNCSTATEREETSVFRLEESRALRTEVMIPLMSVLVVAWLMVKWVALKLHLRNWKMIISLKRILKSIVKSFVPLPLWTHITFHGSLFSWQVIRSHNDNVFQPCQTHNVFYVCNGGSDKYDHWLFNPFCFYLNTESSLFLISFTRQ